MKGLMFSTQLYLKGAITITVSTLKHAHEGMMKQSHSETV